MNIPKKNSTTKNIIAFTLGGIFVLTTAFASTTIDTNLNSAIQYIQKIIFTDNGGASGNTGVIIDGIAGSIGLGDGASVSDIKTTITTTNDTSLATTEAISGFVNLKLDGFIANANSGDFVNITSNQIIAGTKRFNDQIQIEDNLIVDGDTNINEGKIEITDRGSATLNLYQNRSDQDEIGRISFFADGTLTAKQEQAAISSIFIDNQNNTTDLVFYTSYQGIGERMRILGNGKVGIGDSTPGYPLDVNGTIRAQGTNGNLRAENNIYATNDIYADNYYYNSDRRYKKDITIIDSALNKILSINGYSFIWKENEKQALGLIAQELEHIFPTLVITKEDGYKAVKYGNLVAPIIEAIKEFYQEFTNQNIRYEQELELLHQEIKLLKTEINLIKNSK